MGVSVHELPNGLTVYLSPMPGATRIAAAIAVRAGAAQDPKGASGTAHLVEHLMFAGTDRIGTTDFGSESPLLEAIEGLSSSLANASRGDRAAVVAKLARARRKQAAFVIPGELDALYAEMGVLSVDAATTFDGTVFTADVPANMLESWAGLETERLRDGVFRGFYTELEVVRTELRQAMVEGGQGRGEAAVLSALFGTRTGSVLGRPRDLEAPSLAVARAFHRRHYRPDNAAVILAGGFDRARALRVLEATLGQWRSTPVQGGVTSPAPDPGRATTQAGEVHGGRLTRGWRVDPGSPARAATAALGCALVDRARGVPDPAGTTGVQLGCRLERRAAGTAVLVWAEGQADTATLADAIDQAIAGVADGRAGPQVRASEALAREMRRWRLEEDASGRVARLAASYLRGETWRFELDRVDAERRVEDGELARVFAPGRRAVEAVELDGNQPTIAFDWAVLPAAPGQAAGPSDRARRLLEGLPDPIAPVGLEAGADYVRLDAAPGPLLAVPSQGKLFELTYHFDRGYREQPLVCLALAAAERSGAGGRSADALAAARGALGLQVSFHCNARESSVTLRGRADLFAQSVEEVETWLRRSELGRAELEAARRRILDLRGMHPGDRRILGVALRDFAFFGRRSAWLAQPSNATLARANPGDVRDTVRSLLDHRHSVLFFGPNAPAEVAQQVAGHGRRSVGASEPRRFRSVEQTTVFVLEQPGSVADVSVVWPRPPLPARERANAAVVTQILDGDAAAAIGRGLRLDRGLAYAARARYDPGVRAADEGGLRGLIRTARPMEALPILMGLIGRPSFDDDAFQRARGGLQRAIAGATVPGRDRPRQLLTWDWGGDRGDPRPVLFEAVAATQVDVVRRWWTAAGQGPAIVAIMANPNDIDRAALEQLGRVVPVEPKELFSYGGPGGGP